MDITGYSSLASKCENQSSSSSNYSEQQQPSFPNTEHMDNPYTPLLYTPSRREPTSSRYSTALLSILLILFLLNCLVTAEAILSTYQTQFASNPPLTALNNDDKWKCFKLGLPPNNSHRSPPVLPPYSVSWETEGVEFDLPINSEGLFLISRGSLSSGVVRVHQSPDVKDVKVSVVAHYHKKEVLSSARVCLVHPDSAGDGVVILTPFRLIPPRRENSLFFDVDVTLPSSAHHPRHLASFAVDTPRFGLDVEDLSGYSFDAFALKSTNRPVRVTSATSDIITVEGKNLKIEGSFNVTRFLKLSTTNSPIDVSLDVHSNLPSKPTVVVLKSSNGLLKSDVSLFTNSSSGTGGDFRVYAHTSNAALNVSFSASPPDSHLVFEGSTKNAPARAELDAAFEGGFLLRTTQFHPTLHVSPGVKDPTGHGRVREVKDRVVAGRAMIGNVSWVPPAEDQLVDADARAGWASVVTRNAPVTLVL